MNNSTSVTVLAGFLDESGIAYELDEDDERILLALDGVPVIVRYRRGAETLLITVPNILKAPQEGLGAPTPELLNNFLRYVMDVNYKLLVGRFGWDHRDGELIFEVSILCHDVAVSRDQFMANLLLAVQTIQKRQQQLERALWAGLSVEQLVEVDEDGHTLFMTGTGHG
jgi:hypothetical protein